MEDNKSVVILENKELIVDEKTNMLTVLNRKKYNKLYLKKHILSYSLKGFNNVTELIIEHYRDFISDIINKLSIANNLEKLTFKGMAELGLSYRTILYLPNLKSIEFPNTIKQIYECYIVKLDKLKEIIFNISNNTEFLKDNFVGYKKYLIIPESLEKIIIKTEKFDYEIVPDYKITKIGNSGYFEEEGIVLKYENDYIETKVNIKNDKINKINKLTKISDDFIKDGCFYLPDFINLIELNGQVNFNSVNCISFNIDILKNGHNYITLLTLLIPDLKKIIIRRNNEMNLFPNIVISEEEYGKIRKVYIKNQKLFVVFDNKILVVNSNGLKEENEIETNKEEQDKVRTTEDIEISKGCRPYPYEESYINKYSSKQLEYYSYYKKLLELFKINDDKELNNAMNIVEKRLVKILDIDSKEE